MNFLDKAIGVVAPQRALQRVRSRVALELTQDYLDRHAQRFSYDGATAGRRAYGWYAASTDANVELMGSLIWLRNRSRDLIRNNPYSVHVRVSIRRNRSAVSRLRPVRLSMVQAIAGQPASSTRLTSFSQSSHFCGM